MKATRKQIKAANEIAARFSGWHEPQEIAAMYDELEKIGVSTGCITNRQDFPNLGCWQGHCEWYINGEEVENSVFVYSVYEGIRISRATITTFTFLKIPPDDG